MPLLPQVHHVPGRVRRAVDHEPAVLVDGLGGAFVTAIEGDHHNVVGLSLPLLRDLVAELGHTWTDLWAKRR